MSDKIKLAYFGTPIFSVELLKKIFSEGKDTFEVVCAVTQPDKPVGRDQKITPCPVKQFALENNIVVYDQINSDVEETLKSCDIALVFAFGHILKSDLLRAPKYGFWNVHPSALPAYRGPSPIVFPMLLGDSESAISLIQMDEKMDHGAIISQEKTDIPLDILHNELLTKMAQMSYYILFESVKKIATNSLVSTVQDEQKKSFTQLLSRESGYISYEILSKLLEDEILTSEEFPEIIKKFLEKNPTISWKAPRGKILLWNMYRSLSPWPGVWTEVTIDDMKKRLKIIEMSFNEGNPIITQVQLEGKKPVSFASFKSAYPIL